MGDNPAMPDEVSDQLEEHTELLIEAVEHLGWIAFAAKTFLVLTTLGIVVTIVGLLVTAATS